MTEKKFCADGNHEYKEVDVVASLFDRFDALKQVSVVVACMKCDSRFLKLVEKPIP